MICRLQTQKPGRLDAGIIQSKSKGQRIQGATGISPVVQRPKNQEFLCLRAGEDGRPTSRREGGIHLSSTFLLY